MTPPSTPFRRRRTRRRPAGAGSRPVAIPDVPAGKEFLFLFDYGDEWTSASGGPALARRLIPVSGPGNWQPATARRHPVPGGRGRLGRAGRGRGVPGPVGTGRSRGDRGPAAGVTASGTPAAASRGPGAACRRLRAGFGQHDPAVETIRRAAALDPPLPANDNVALWLAAAGALIAMRERAGWIPSWRLRSWRWSWPTGSAPWSACLNAT